MSVHITKDTKIKVSIGTNEIELTEQEARELQGQLNWMFGLDTPYGTGHCPQDPCGPLKYKITCSEATNAIYA